MQVLDQNVKEEVKNVGFVAMEEVTFEQIMDEYDAKTQGAQEKAESPYDTESEIKTIKTIKSYQAATISGSLFIHQISSYDQDKDAEEGEASKSLSGLRYMPDDDLASISGFETQDSTDHVSEEGTKTLHAFADKPAQSDPLGHLHAELGTLNTKIDYSVSASIAEELPQVEAHNQKNLHDQLPNILLKPMYKEFNAFNKLESQRFVLLQNELSKSLHNKMRKSIRLEVRKGMKEVKDKLSFCTSIVDTISQHVQDVRIMFKDMVSLLEVAEVFKKANAEGEKWEKNNPAEEKDAQHPHQTKGEKISGANTVDIKSEGTVSMEDDSDDDDLDKQPLLKRFKIMTPIPNPIPLNTFVPEHLLKPEEQQKSVHEFTDQLFGTTSSKFSPTPPKEPTPPRDPAKGKEVSIVKEQVNELVTYQEEGGFIPKMLKIKSFITPERTLSQEEFINQIKEMKRLSNLKATLKAQAQKWTEHEAKKAKMMEEYKHQISFRADQLPIIKISYVVNPNKEATMKITRGDNHLNLVVHPNFRLKTLGFSEWLEVHALASKKSGKSNDMLLQEKENDIDYGRDVMKGLFECKASESNIKHIRVKDIVKKVKDYLKTYPLARMDIIWHETQYLLKARQKAIELFVPKMEGNKDGKEKETRLGGTVLPSREKEEKGQKEK
ncbi:hypothetical protein Tco_1249258 [Tanacetum coccineum]